MQQLQQSPTDVIFYTFKRILGFGLFTGLYLFLLEAIERNYSLSPYFIHPIERLMLFGNCTFTALGILLSVSIATLPFLITTFILNKYNITKDILKLFLAFCIYISQFLIILLTTYKLTYPLFTDFLQKLVDKSIPLTPKLANHPLISAIGILLICASLLAVMHTDYIKNNKLTTTKIGILIIFSLFFTLGNVFYWADGHLFVGHYETTFHKPLCILQIATIFFSAIILGQIPKIDKTMQRLIVVLSIVLTIAATSVLFYFDQNQNVKALIWRRGILLRQFVQLTQQIFDSDRDGFSSILGGGDTNDHNPQINPLAAEEPNNEINENNFGSDGQITIPSVYQQTISAKTKDDSTQTTKPNILFISIDTLRADHLGCYGYTRRTSPNIDKFASESLLFLKSYSQASNTGHSFSSIMTSSYGEDIFSEKSPTITTILEENGYRTILLSSRSLNKLLKNKRWAQYRSIMYRGIDKSDAIPDTEKLEGSLDAKYLTNKLIEFLKTNSTSNNHQNNPFFIWAHFTDPHAEYFPHQEFNFGKDDIDLYDGEIAYTDHHLGKLFTYLEQSKLLENTLVIITADHGESFGEHGANFHGSRPYQEQIHVPLIVRAPNTAPRKINNPVASIDIATTMLSTANLPLPPTFQGINLLKVANNEDLPSRVIISETPRNLTEPNFQAWAIMETDHPQWKLIYDAIGNTWELYNLYQDPNELHNVIDQYPKEANFLKQAFGEWMDVQSMHPNFRNWK